MNKAKGPACYLAFWSYFLAVKDTKSSLSRKWLYSVGDLYFKFYNKLQTSAELYFSSNPYY